jgi:hypothetical protein
MKRIVLAGTILASFAIAAGASTLVPRPSTASLDTKSRPAPKPEVKLAKAAETPIPKLTTEVTLAESGRLPVPLMRAPKREATEPAVTAEATPPPAPPVESRQFGTVDEGRRWADASPRWPEPHWMQPGVPPPPPAFVQRDQEPRYFVIPIDGQRVLVVGRDFHGGGKKHKGRGRGRDRD